MRSAMWLIFEKWHVSKRKYQLFIPFSNARGFPNTLLCVPKSDIHKSPPCRTWRLTVSQSSRYNKIISICQSFLLNESPDYSMSWLRAGTCRFGTDYFWGRFGLFILRPKMWEHHHLCRLFQLIGLDRDLQNGAHKCTLNRPHDLRGCSHEI